MRTIGFKKDLPVNPQLRIVLELTCTCEFFKKRNCTRRAISAFWKTHSCKLIPNWTQNHMITYTNTHNKLLLAFNTYKLLVLSLLWESRVLWCTPFPTLTLLLPSDLILVMEYKVGPPFLLNPHKTLNLKNKLNLLEYLLGSLTTKLLCNTNVPAVSLRQISYMPVHFSRQKMSTLLWLISFNSAICVFDMYLAQKVAKLSLHQ